MRRSAKKRNWAIRQADSAPLPQRVTWDAASDLDKDAEIKEEPTCHRPEAGARTLIESSVYWSPKTGAHVVQGEIRQKWLSMGGHESELGYPISDEMDTPDGHGRRSLFEFGEISWYPDSGAIMKKDKRD